MNTMHNNRIRRVKRGDEVSDRLLFGMVKLLVFDKTFSSEE